ncbi:hypothetical protein DSCW_45310 [Desulfosarcina widdelii]|uniref:Uncharacterized protein n=1 Tax=Desulfosarcina widdelii TaxID=947919 RepID=A0A5K7ZFJ9_9BACT|nr:hypothetical protein DSCW_45310 [Desulfosarcina widdelii]
MRKFGSQGEISETINIAMLAGKSKYSIVTDSYIVGTSVAQLQCNTPSVGSEIAEGSAKGVWIAGGDLASPGRTGVRKKQ